MICTAVGDAQWVPKTVMPLSLNFSQKLRRAAIAASRSMSAIEHHSGWAH